MRIGLCESVKHTRINKMFNKDEEESNLIFFNVIIFSCFRTRKINKNENRITQKLVEND